jgi:hypothetical protein
MSISNWQGSYYDFGSWGYFTQTLKDEILRGFVATPPGIEICGEYDIVFVAALKYDHRISNANMHLRRTISEGNLDIHRSFSGMIFSGKVTLNPNQGCDHHFGPGYNFFGFPSPSELARSYEWKPSNASIIKTELNHNIGRLYVVSDRKAFRLIDNEKGPMRYEGIIYESSQEHEVQEAEENCKNFRKRHLSFLCRELGLPCQVASQISQYVIAPPFIFAEPGDVWIDIRLSTPKRTHVLARRRRT